MNFETLLLRLMLAAAIVGGLCLASLAFDRRRRRPSPFQTKAFRSAHVQPTQKPSPTVAEVRRSVTIAERPRVSASPTRQWERQTNSGMY